MSTVWSKKILVVLALIVALAFVAACAAPTPEPTKPPAAAPTPTKGPALAKEQILRVPTGEPPSLDPGLAQDTTSLGIVVQLFDALLDVDDKGNLIPMLAEKWSVSPDGLTYTFNIRKGPKWTDGTPVTAKDFEYAWKRAADPATASPYAKATYPIKNAMKFNKGEIKDPDAVGVKATDDYTLVVTLEEPAGYFLRLASTWTLMAVPRQAIEKHGKKWTEAGNIVTNGPFKLEKWEHDKELVLVPNPDYWGKKPTLTKVIRPIYPGGTEAQQLAAYENNELDAGVALPPADVDRILKDPVLSKEVYVYDSSGTYFLSINNKKPPLNDKRVRQALSMVLDRQKIIDLAKVIGKPAPIITPPGIDGHNPAFAKYTKVDVAGAKKLLAEAGYPDGKGMRELVYTYNTAAVHKTIAEYLQATWKETLGINVKLESMEWAVFLKWRTEADYDIYRGGWLSDYEDPNNWHNILWDSAQDYFNVKWKNDEFDKLVRAARGESDPKKRKEMYEQAEQILAEEMPVIPIYYYGGRELVRPYVDGWVRGRILGFVYYKNVRILEKK